MAINNLNPRRTVWFSPHEPLNKYDIWLSKNAHYDENGESITDSDAQRDCDYIFKIYDCGKSPAELFDAGTIGNAILTFVSETDWQSIFEGDAFSNAFEEYFQNMVTEGDTNIINNLLDPANHEYLGGIWADRFTQSYNGDQYLAQCKYKYQPNNNSPDYNLYVHAKDIIPAINHLTESDEYHLNIDFATTTDIGGILSDTHGRIPDESYRFYPIECMFYPDYQQYELKQGRLCTNAYEIKVALNYVDNVLYDEDPTSELIVNGWKGVQTEMRDSHSGVWIRANVESIGLGNPPTSLSITNSNVSGQENSIIITGDNNYEKIVGPYEVFDNSLTSTSYSIDISMSLSQNTNPIYLRVNANAITLSEDTKYICDEELFIDSDTIDKGNFLITIQFGIVKIEKINKV